MKLCLCLLFVVGATVAGIIPNKPERKLGDEVFLKRQKEVLDLLLGLTFDLPADFPHSDLDIFEHPEFFTNPDVLSKFQHHYHHGFLPKDAVHSHFCHHTKKQTLMLFDLFFFAKDFETFYKVAVWARARMNPYMFYYAFRQALEHRPDSRSIIIPPIYETFPYFYVPAETMMKFSKARHQGYKTATYHFNNTGDEDYYHTSMFGGLFGPSANYHSEDVLGYFREDVGFNQWYINYWFRNPSWLNTEKYNMSTFKQGENFYYIHQQILARYTLERIANKLPSVDILEWDKPISSGYNPRLVYHTGAPFFPRPDHFNPHEHNSFDVDRTRLYEHRLIDAVDNGYLAAGGESKNLTLEDGVDYLGKTVLGSKYGVSKQFYGAYYFNSLKALGFAVKTDNDREFVGGVMSSKITALRDPAFFNFLHRLIGLFQVHKSHFKSYQTNEIVYPQVHIKSVEVDKLVTFFDEFEFETSAAFVPGPSDSYKESVYLAKQKRLNHKPFTYKVTVESETDGDWMARVFLGPKYDAEGRQLILDQSRLAFVELDRFAVKMKTGENVFERNSRESPAYAKDPEGFRSLYSRVKNAIEKKEPFYIEERGHCGVPERLQVPRGWKSGREWRLFVLLTPVEGWRGGTEVDVACGGSGLNDGRPLGFPFDRPIHGDALQQPNSNAFFQDVLIFHKDDSESNRPSHP